MSIPSSYERLKLIIENAHFNAHNELTSETIYVHYFVTQGAGSSVFPSAFFKKRVEIEIRARRVQIVYYDTRAGSSISDTLDKKRVHKIELSTGRIKNLCTIHVRERDSRLVCLSTLASLGCKRHTRRKSTFPH